MLMKQSAFMCPRLWHLKHCSFGKYLLKWPESPQYQHLFLLLLLYFLKCLTRNGFPFIFASSCTSFSSKSKTSFWRGWFSLRAFRKFFLMFLLFFSSVLLKSGFAALLWVCHLSLALAPGFHFYIYLNILTVYINLYLH